MQETVHSEDSHAGHGHDKDDHAGQGHRHGGAGHVHGATHGSLLWISLVINLAFVIGEPDDLQGSQRVLRHANRNTACIRDDDSTASLTNLRENPSRTAKALSF